MIEVIKLTLDTGAFVLTTLDNRLSLVEFCRDPKFGAEMVSIQIADCDKIHVKKLADLVYTLNHKDNYKSPSLTLIETSSNSTPRGAGDPGIWKSDVERANSLKDRIEKTLLEEGSLSVATIASWNTGLSKGAICRHFSNVRNDLKTRGKHCIKAGHSWQITS